MNLWALTISLTLYVLLEYLINVHEAAWKYYDKGIINQEEADYYIRSLCKLIEQEQYIVMFLLLGSVQYCSCSINLQRLRM